jgi:hypothetical protein
MCLLTFHAKQSRLLFLVSGSVAGWLLACRPVLAVEDMYIRMLLKLDEVFSWSKKARDPKVLLSMNDTIIERLEDEEYARMIPAEHKPVWHGAQDLLNDLNYGYGTRWILRRRLPVGRGVFVDKELWERKVQPPLPPLLCSV